jgi:hypothetical protein
MSRYRYSIQWENVPLCKSRYRTKLDSEYRAQIYRPKFLRKKPKMQCCGSGMFIPDPRSRILIFTHPGSQISDPGSKNSKKREEWNKICCHTFFCSHKVRKIENYFFSEMLKEKFGPISKNYITFYPKSCHSALKNMGLGSGIRDPGSGKNLFWIPDPGVKKAPDPGSWIRIRNTAKMVITHERIRACPMPNPRNSV